MSIRPVKTLIKGAVAQIFRRAKIKRRSAVTGAFESEWLDISKEIKSFGKVTNQIDSARRYKFTFGTVKLVAQNDSGKFNPNDDPSSLWFGYLNQQRTLVRLEAGFLDPVKDENGIWTRNETPNGTLWDDALWDNVGENTWDDDIISPASIFVGVISGDLVLSDKNDVSMNLRPLVSVFQDFPARNLTGYTSTGLTASQFIGVVRDQTDGSGNYIFRPFFGDTLTYWDVSTTSIVYTALNTATSDEVVDRTVWEVIEKLAEAENFVPYITRDGVFKFVRRSTIESTALYEFHGAGSFSSEYGHTIKTVNSFGFRISKYYSRVQLKFIDEQTTTSYAIFESTLTVSASSNPWVFGVRTLSIDNYLIPTSTAANALAEEIFDEVSALKKEIEFTTSFIPHLDLFDRFSIHYEPAIFRKENLWDLNDWASQDTTTAFDLIWDAAQGDGIVLQGQEFKFLTFEIDLDNLQNRFIAREV